MNSVSLDRNLDVITGTVICASCSNGPRGHELRAWRPLAGEYKIATGTQQTIDYDAFTPTGLFIGYNGDNNNRSFDGWIAYVYVWGRELSIREIESVWANPWQLFKPHMTPVFKDEELTENKDQGIIELPWDRNPGSGRARL